MLTSMAECDATATAELERQVQGTLAQLFAARAALLSLSRDPSLSPEALRASAAKLAAECRALDAGSLDLLERLRQRFGLALRLRGLGGAPQPQASSTRALERWRSVLGLKRCSDALEQEPGDADEAARLRAAVRAAVYRLRRCDKHQTQGEAEALERLMARLRVLDAMCSRRR
eukprot:m51a1_g1441 hypothetical protein (174) ;mRNA; f:123206-123872